MKKMILCLLVLSGTISAMADILLPPEEEAHFKRQYEQGLARCPKEKPLYDGEKCYSCNEPKDINIARYMQCKEICPNRYATYRYGSVCALK